jgi:asparagine synthase (glutamine-hydrolysing)
VSPVTAATSGWISTGNTSGRPSATGTLGCLAGHRVGSDDGVYGGWIWDGGTLRVEHDRYGMFPLFRSSSTDGSLLSTDLLQLVERGAPTSLDLDALSVFLRLGFFVGDDTPFTSIRAVLPPRPGIAAAGLSRAAAIRGYIDLVRQAIRRRLPTGPFALPLSGGRDSRHLLYELLDAGYPPARCVTVRHFPPRGNEDEEIARALCERLGLPHVVLDQPRDRIDVERRKNRRTHFCTEEHGQFVVLADYLSGATRETFDGIAGDVLSQSGYADPALLALFRRGDVRGVADFLLHGHGNVVTERALSRLVAPSLHRHLSRERAVARLEREIATHLDAVNPIASFYFWNRTRREVALAPYGLQREITTFAPFLDRDVFDFLCSLPPELTIDRTLHTEAIATAFPGYADIAYARPAGRSEDAGLQRTVAWGLLRMLARSGKRPLLNRAGLLPSIGMTLVTGSTRRLWAVAFAIWLDQVNGLAET